MFIAMNRFKIKIGNEKEFENVWKNRETFLDKVVGFKSFNLVKGKTTDEFTLYASHSIWENEDHFINWTKSEEFRMAHKNASNNKKLYLGHPEFEGFKKIL
tara:strand:+ start:372 stop:674 length:303 start_codon:yes stop_codon:yes gene_type:complete